MEKNAFEDSLMQAQIMTPMSPSTVIQTDQYPDMLQQCSIDQCKLLFETLSVTNNPSLVNKVGSVGGYTALHW